MTGRSWLDAVAALDGIVARAARKLHAGGEPARVEHAALRAAADELRELDAPALASRPEVGQLPPHPAAGRPAGDAAGHCWACVVLGHLVVHPDLACSAVGCDGSHAGEPPLPVERSTDLPPAGPVDLTQTLRLPPELAALGGFDPTVTVDLSRFQPGGPPWD